MANGDSVSIQGKIFKIVLLQRESLHVHCYVMADVTDLGLL